MARAGVLVVTAEPDEHDSSVTLATVVDELRRRDGVDVETWFLRDLDARLGPGDLDAGVHVVDELRTWAPAAALDRRKLGVAANVLRGRRLRRWIAHAHPDVVVFDDGLGSRLFDADGGPPFVRAVRHNSEVPVGARLEPAPLGHYDILLAADDAPARPHDAAWLATPDLLPVADMVAGASAAEIRLRSELSLAPDTRLVVGWGSDDWVDGPDLFVRALWHLEHREGVVAHGVWLDAGIDPHEHDRLHSEARRCGLGDRYHTPRPVGVADRWAGDLVLLPHRAPASSLAVLQAVVAGRPVVTFEPAVLDHPMVRAVPSLDLDAMASAAVRALNDGDDDTLAVTRARADVVGWVDRFLDLVEERRSR